MCRAACPAYKETSLRDALQRGTRRNPLVRAALFAAHDAAFGLRRYVTHAVRDRARERQRRAVAFVSFATRIRSLFRSAPKPKTKWGRLFGKVGEGTSPTKFVSFSRPTHQYPKWVALSETKPPHIFFKIFSGQI